MLHDLENDESLLGANRLCKLAGLEREGPILEHLRQLAALVLTQIAALGGRGAVAEAAGQLPKVAPGVEFCFDIVGFRLGSRQFCGIVGLHAARLRR